MDEMDPKPVGETEPDVPRGSEAESEAERFAREMRQGGWRSLFFFDAMYFPVFAHYVFIVFVVLVLLAGLGGIVAAFAAMARVGFSDGMYTLLQSVVMVAFLLVVGRLWIELAMVVFKINEAVQDIRRHIKKLK
jgi:fumarate reductase subunit C